MQASNQAPGSSATRPRADTAARYQPLVIVATAFSAGILADRCCSLPAPGWWIAAVVTVSAWLPAMKRGRLASASLLLCAACAALGGAWHHVRWHLFAEHELARFATTDGGPVCLRARAAGNVSWLPVRAFDPLRALPERPQSRLRLRVEAVRNGDRWRPAAGTTMLTADGRLSGIEAGARLQIVGQLSVVAPPMNPGEFDYAAHARADRQLTRLWADSLDNVVILSQPDGWSPSRWLHRARAAAGRLLAAQVAPERWGLASAMLLGTRDQLDALRTQSYFVTGMVHVLSISGLHVGILAAGLFWLLRLGLVERRGALAAVALVTLAYAVLIGAEAPAVRATIIVLVACGSLSAGRQALEYNSLAAAALVVLVMNPADLFRAGPQLSFLAAATLAWWSQWRYANAARPDALDRLIAESRPWFVQAACACGRVVGQMLAVSVAVWAISLPLVAWQFHIVAPAALLLTPLLALPFATGLFAGLALVFLGWLAPPLAAAAGWLCDRSLAAGDAIVHWAAAWPGSHLWIAGPAGWWVAGFYALTLVWAFARHRLPRPRGAVLILTGWSLVGLAPTLVRGPADDALTCTFLSVGHGCAAVVESPDGKTLLYDAGRLGSPHGAAQSISAYLWSRGIRRLDAAVVSHADIDHFNGLPELLERFPIDTLYLAADVLQHPPRSAALLIAAARHAGTRLKIVAAGDALPLGRQLRASVLHPAAGTHVDGDNANSIVLLLECHGRRLLLPGDLEGAGLARLLEQAPAEVDVLLAPHHGSPRSNPAGLADWARPRWVVVSGSAKDDSRELSQTYRAQGARVLHTSRCGAVTITSSRGALDVSCFRQAR